MQSNSISMNKGFDLQNRTALIFGGTSGIGKTIALAMANAGADVVAVSRRQEEVNKTTAEIQSLGRKTTAITCDVCKREQVREVIEKVREQFGRIDVLVNSAGRSGRIPTLEMPQSHWDSVMDVNLNGTWYACQLAGELMKDQGEGNIINIASLGAFVTLHEVTPYCVSKAAVAMLTKCLAAEWAKYNIRVNAIAPGVFETPLNTHLIHEPNRKNSILSRTPMGRFGRLEELIGAALYLASDLSSFTTGEIMCVDGGFLVQGVGP